MLFAVVGDVFCVYVCLMNHDGLVLLFASVFLSVMINYYGFLQWTKCLSKCEYKYMEGAQDLRSE